MDLEWVICNRCSRSIPNEALDHQLGMGEGYILLNVIVNSDGEIIEIDNNFVYSTIGFIMLEKKVYLSL